ncbi:hypothetical protein ACFY2W_36250 [Streptomyces sp. NPDC001262]|uniref:hypothetical protein n=1 Tax=Streptomyces sp. NPDC001262 TaxID=3364552 RepID=UPI0036CAF2A4
MRLPRWMPHWLGDLVVELVGNWKLSRAIDRAFAAGDPEALAVFRTGTFAATFTRKGFFARGEEMVAYAERVIAADGSPYRYHRMFADFNDSN